MAGVAALVLAACTTGGDTDEPAASSGTVRIAEVNELSSFNTDSVIGNVDINSQVAYLSQSAF